MDNPLSDRKSQLSAAKQALLARRLQGQRGTRPAIPHRPPDQPVPLSFSQQRLWFLYQLEPDNPVYNVPFALHLQGNLDLSALQRAWQTLAQRHEILRTTFTQTATEPRLRQVIHPETGIALSPVELTHLGQSVWAEVRRLAHKEALQPFDLRQGPLWRVTLLRLAEQEFVLLVTLHHIISDVWSTGVLVREMTTLYYAFAQAKPNPLAPLPIQYGDFTLWQRQSLQGERLETLLNYWQSQFATLPPTLQLPTDRPRPSVQSFRGDRRQFWLSAELTTALKRLGQNAEATLFMVLLAAFKTLLYRYSGQTDLTVGSPIANRNQAAIEGLIGLFMNTLALRTQLSGELTFQELLERVRQMALEAYSHQDLPFERLVEALPLTRDLSQTPLFQVMVILQNAPGAALSLPGLSLSRLELPNPTAKFDLTLIAAETEDGLQGIVEYSSDLFDADTIERLIGHFQTLLNAIVARPNTRLSQLPLMTPTEQQQLAQWRQVATIAPPPLCLHQIFEAQAAKDPDAIAVIFEQQSLTYGELNQRANQLARHLWALGVGPEILVGLCLERSLEMIVGLLGILKAGGAYVPLDPAYPRSRLQFMVDDTQLSVCVTQAEQLESLPEFDAQVVCLGRDWPTIAQASPENLASPVTADNLAYIIYTSGSTGRPKGVMIPHQNGVRLFKAAEQHYEFSDRDCWTLFHSYAFDFSVWEIWGALLYGGRLVVVPHWVSRSPKDFYQLLIEQQVTVLNQTPSAFRQLVAAESEAVDVGAAEVMATEAGAAEASSTHASYPADALKLRYVIFGGEALAMPMLGPWFERHGDQQPQLVNMYGITETTVHVTHRRLGKTDLDCSGSPIGQALADLQTTVLDSHLQPVPVGVPGELHVGGAGLARGYFNRPQLTAEKFIANPLGPGRLYKTGDLVRYRPDGRLDYLGRIDHQVKIRGFRIELGEIEAVLQQHPQIDAVAVLVRTERSEQTRLVAYLTPQSPQSPRSPETAEASRLTKVLRQWLQEKLPDYMIPAAFVWLAQMPLNTNGKTDRAALQAYPVPDLDRTMLAEPFIAPRSPIEQQLAAIWTEILDVSPVGIDDNFFELGGDSILSLQIIAQSSQAGLSLTPKQLFQHQTIRALAAEVEAAASESAKPIMGPVTLTPLQRGWLATTTVHAELPSVQIVLHPPLELEDLRVIMHYLLNHHDALRLSFQPEAAAWSQDNCPPLPSPTDLPDSAVIEVTVMGDGVMGDGVISGPLFQAALQSSSEPDQPSQLRFTLHPLVSDRRSWEIVLTDFQTLWQQQRLGQSLELPPKTVSFQQWANGLPFNPLPDQADPVESAGRGSLTVSLDQAETDRLLLQVPPIYQTQTSDLLLTALAQINWLQIDQAQADQAQIDWPKASAIAVDWYQDGRDASDGADLSRTVGQFGIVCPVDLSVPKGADSAMALKTIKEQLRQGAQSYPPAEQRPRAAIGFEHVDLDTAATLARLSLKIVAASGLSQTLLGRLSYPLSLESRCEEGQLQICWRYCQKRYSAAAIAAIAEEFLGHLRSLIDHCLSPGAGGYTPSDLPLAQLDQASLDRLVARQPQLEDCYPLTPIQQGFLFHTLYTGNSLYVTQMHCCIQGQLNVAALQRTWQIVSDRHAVLRTAFVWEDVPQPLQVVQRQVNVPWQVFDWRGQPPEQQQAEMAALIQRDRATEFQPQTAPLMRLMLVQLSDERYDIFWSCHHLLLDGWSMPMVIQEVFTVYESLIQDQPALLPDRRPYRDYIAWLANQELAAAADFWTTLLQGFRSATPLGYKKTSATPDHDLQGFTLAASTTQALQALAQRQRLTLNTVIQGLWAILLGQISGDTDLLFGATTAGRPPTLADVDKMVGLFINTLPVRVQLTPEQPISQWLKAIQTQQSQARQYEHSPLNQIQRWSDVSAGTPLFESLIVFENYRVDPAVISAQTELQILSVTTARNNNYPLTLRVLPREDFVLQIMSDRTCFAAETTAGWLNHIDAMLQWLVAYPDAAVGDWQTHLSSLDRQQQQQQAQSQAQTRLKKLRTTRRKAVRAQSPPPSPQQN